MSHEGPLADDELLLRRIHPDFQRPDGSVSSQAFTDSEMSVDRQALLASPEETLQGWEGSGLVALVAGDLRSLGLAVQADPTASNPAHALVVGKKTKSAARRIARMAVWVRRIGDR